LAKMVKSGASSMFSKKVLVDVKVLSPKVLETGVCDLEIYFWAETVAPEQRKKSRKRILIDCIEKKIKIVNITKPKYTKRKSLRKYLIFHQTMLNSCFAKTDCVHLIPQKIDRNVFRDQY